MFVSLLQELIAGQAPPIVPLTVEQYHQMLAKGIIQEGAPIELIDGFLVRKDRSARGESIMTIGKSHRLTFKRLDKTVDRAITGHDCHTLNQAPITIPNVNEPEPDLSLVRGQPEAYAARHPGPSDLLGVFEVSDSSLQYDRTTKLRLFAAAAISQYCIVNLVDDQIEVYSSPIPAEGRYAERTDYRRGQSIRLFLDAGAAVAIAVGDVLPPL